MRIKQVQEKIKFALECSLKEISKRTPPLEPLPPHKIELEIPKDYKHGDLTTNIAMRLARSFSSNSVKLAGLLKDVFEGISKTGALSRIIGRVDVSPPGFINFWFSREYLYDILSQACMEKRGFGKNTLGNGMRVNIEFVSANPTGPLTIAHGRQAAVGDALGRILQFSGYRVWKEYFINDVGTQIDLLGMSIHARYLSLCGIDNEFPADGYHGEYIKDIALEVRNRHGDRFIGKTPENRQFFSQLGVRYILKTIEEDLRGFGVSFDKWFSQRKISRRQIENVLGGLRAKGYIYEKEGATWFKSTAFGDDKDRVVIKTDKALTYLAPDIAYHLDKYKRGFGRLIDIWGPDHHGYIPRLVAAVEALGYDKGSISILIVQLASLFRNGVALSMSTRKGEFVTLKEVMDEVGCDVAKFFFLMRKLDSHLDFDLEVA
ncbi:MAG: arginine--tRNA ligase, partial [Omnitrophica bacterium RBG_13_46_9]